MNLSNGVQRKEIKNGLKTFKKCWTSLAIRGMQIKTKLRFYHTPVKISKFKENMKTNAANDMGKGNTYASLVEQQMGSAIIEISFDNYIRNLK